MVIYVDILLAVNGWIDWLLLSGTRRIGGVAARPWRMAVGAAVGALFSLTVLLPPQPVWLSLSEKLIAAAVMTAAAFSPLGWRGFCRCIAVLFALSVGLAGVCAALYFFAAPVGFYVANGVVYYSVPPLLLVGLTAAGYLLLTLIERYCRRRAPAGHTYYLRVTYRGETARLRCLYDSGNHLQEPFSGLPVVVAERDSLRSLGRLPTPRELMENPISGWRTVPFSSIGGEGFLPAFRSDATVLETPDGDRTLGACYVAVCDRLGRGEYGGLIGSTFGEELVSKESV